MRLHALIALAYCLGAALPASAAPPRVPSGSEGRFIRGEIDGRPGIDLGDALAVLLALEAGRPLPCADAADTNDDGSLSLADAVFLLDFLYRGGLHPPAPSGACGLDPTPDGLGCAAGSLCGEADAPLAPIPTKAAQPSGRIE